MVEELRKRFNERFSTETYQKFLAEIKSQFNYQQPFRIAETPAFISKSFYGMVEEACAKLIEVIASPDYKSRTEASFHENTLRVPNETDKPLFLVFDFGVCSDENGNLIPQLIELQGFPSLYNFQNLLADTFRKVYPELNSLKNLPSGLTSEEYHELLNQAILGGHRPENVVLLEIEPDQQATAIDFYCARKDHGIKLLCVTDMFAEGDQLFYSDDSGQKIQVKRIYNRVIFDELERRPDLNLRFDFTKPYDVEWAGHPNWFYRISKFSLPLFSSRYVPETHYLDQIDEYPHDLENFVLKPLYSFAGAGVELHITRERLDVIENRENYILQRKVHYEPVIQTPDIPAKMELRVMLLWLPDEERPRIVNNLVRLSKGEMIGVKYNKDKTWVGGTVGFFEV